MVLAPRRAAHDDRRFTAGMVLVVSLGLSAALIYGISDFLGGFAASRFSALQVTLIAFLAGLIVSLAFLPFVVSAWTAPALVYGAIAGVTAAVSIWLLYSCFAIGPVSLLAPLVALIAALVPVVYGLSRHERIDTVGKVAIGAVLASAALIGYTPGSRRTPVRSRALLLGIAAGLATGGYLVALDYTPSRSGAVPIVVVFIAGSLLLALAAAAAHWRHSPARVPCQADVGGPPWQRQVPLILAIISGMTQAVADVMAIIGIHLGDLAVIGALVALYPLGTIMLAVIVNRERPTPLQFAGVALAVAASVALSAAPHAAGSCSTPASTCKAPRTGPIGARRP